MSSIIKTLPQVLIDQIAAGEVVERPASAVKELLENALDAGARRIVIEIEAGGKNLIMVKDDGCGMSEEDARLALRRFTTSKIFSLEDLHTIKSFGFRGEALSAIASVSRLTLVTKQKGSLSGWKVDYVNGEEIAFSPIGCSEGTSVTVEGLFAGIPARKKYLKTDQAEFKHIVSCVMSSALAHPAVGFKFIHNGKIIFDVPSTPQWMERIRNLLGEEITRELVPVECENGTISLRGFIGKPHVSEATRRHQYLFINKRDVVDTTVARACFDAYAGMLFSRTYPVFLFDLTLDPILVDVNVHPRKKEVKFLNSQDIYRTVLLGVKDALRKYVLFPVISAPETTGRLDFSSPKAEIFMSARVQKPLHEQRLETFNDLEIEPIAQVADSYIIARAEDGIWIIDQHAAHERVLYERTKKALINNAPVKQPLLVPQEFEFSLKEKTLIEEHRAFLEQLGFEIELFGGNTFVMHALPAQFAEVDMALLFRSLFEELESGEERSVSPQEKIIRMIACKAAVKFGQSLSVSEQKQLLKDWFKSSERLTCPHGRPVMVQVTFEELERRFKRT